MFGLITVVALSFVGDLVLRLAGAPNESQPSVADTTAGNVRVEGGIQIVEITAKGGYAPRASTVKAGIPTVIRFNTKGTFDCSSSVRIPSLNISRSLPASGVTEITVGTLEPGVLEGMCGMGMYPFQLNVQS